MSIGEIIKQRRKELGLSAEDIAKKAGVSPATIYRYESGDIRNPRSSILRPMAEVLNLDLYDLVGWSQFILDDRNDMWSQSSIKAPTASAAPKPYRRIPVLGSIPAGVPIEAVEEIEDWEDLPESMFKGGAEYFALKVKGDSMSPKYEDGDVLILRRQGTCDNGQDCAVLVNGDDATFKRVRLSERGITLQPLNPKYDPIFYTNQEGRDLPIRILGVVVELRRRIQ